ncbi:hypothetical protein K3495_g130 [Podosphaera aphanis]|nr:hypothetical protein K3495_g130 [Podosphaera aphanis]
MQTVLALTLAAAVAYVAPVAATPPGCSQSYNGEFQITVVKPNTVRRLAARDNTCGQEGYLTLRLENGQLIDSKGRLGYIASNYQFQFDGPPQENADSVGGYSACNNGSLALKESDVFYQCLSGDFYNLYDRSWAPQCSPIFIDLLPCSQGAPAHPGAPASTGSPVSQIGDGQPQAPSATTRIPVSQIPDGQPQAPTATSRVPVSQIPDGQPQNPVHNTYQPTGKPITQIPDGQPQAPTGMMKPSGGPGSKTYPETTATSPPLAAGASRSGAGLICASIIATLTMAMLV